MTNAKKLKRIEFIRLALMSTAATCLDSCQPGGGAKSIKETMPRSVSEDTVIKPVNIQPSYQLYEKGDPQYDILRKAFNTRIAKFPRAIIRCSTTEDVAQAVA